MGESKEQAIARLLREGLNFYGMGKVPQALRRWREVLALDPDHPEARDYVETASQVEAAGVGTHELAPESLEEPPASLPEDAAASFDAWELLDDDPLVQDAEQKPAPPAAPAKTRDAVDSLLADGQRLVREGDLEAALDLFEAVALRDPARLEAQGYVEMVRTRLLKRYRERLGEGGGVPRVAIGFDQVLKFNLPAQAGFVLSLVDGATTVEDVVSLSGMDAFEALRLLCSLVDSGIVGVSR